MSNSKLYGKIYNVPKEIISTIKMELMKSPHGDGVKRAKFLVNNGTCTYQQLKRLKNYFDNNPDVNSQEYGLVGGDKMYRFVNQTLDSERKNVEVSKDITSSMHNDLTHNRISRIRKDGIRENEEVKTLKINALAVIFNKDMDILLLKRNPERGTWMPNKFALVGGGVDEGETPIQAIEREIREETGLEINNFTEKFVLQRNEDSVEHVFITKYNGDGNDVQINEEHNDFGWFNLKEIEELDAVPNLLDYIKIAIEKYD